MAPSGRMAPLISTLFSALTRAGGGPSAASYATTSSRPTSRGCGWAAAATCIAAARRTRCERALRGRLQIDRLHARGRVTLARGGAERERVVQALQIVVGELD